MRQFIPNRFPRPQLSTTTVVLLVALYIALAENRLFWRSFIARLGLNTFDHWAFLFTVGLAFVLLLNVILSLFAFRQVFKPFLILLLLTTATINYFSDTFSIVIDRSMIHNILETDVGEASELLTWPFFRYLLLFGALPATLVALIRIRYRSRKKELLIRIGLVFGSLGLLLCLGLINYKQFVLFSRENRDLRIFLNPSYAFYSLGRVIDKKYFAYAEEPLQVVATDAIRPDDAPRAVVVLVLGETARAREFAFNGYQRDTNPQLAKREVINFPNVQACGTSTTESLPCIFSSLERENYNRDKAGRQENLLDILQRVGVTVLWRDNNSGSKGVADRVEFEDLSRLTDTDLCVSDNCFDEILLRGLDRRLAETTEDMLIVLHMKGSHGPSYYKRTPPAFKVFSPECTMNNIQDCPQQAIVNAYDNTIVYTDHVLAKLIDLLRAKNFATAMLYVSDHGESLGENGLFCKLSVVIPVFNEEENVLDLAAEVLLALKGIDHEVIFVDDGSDDNTTIRLMKRAAKEPRIRLIRHRSNCGQSAAIVTGVQSARAPWVATLDGDGQNDPADIVKLLEAARDISSPPVCVCGERRQRRDSWSKRFSSRIANQVRSHLLGDRVADTGCGLKLFRRDAFLDLPRFDHMHRFLPALFLRDGGKIVSLPVNHRPRRRGVSKYGLHNRLWVGLVDLLGVLWLQRRAWRPELEDMEDFS